MDLLNRERYDARSELVAFLGTRGSEAVSTVPVLYQLNEIAKRVALLDLPDSCSCQWHQLTKFEQALLFPRREARGRLHPAASPPSQGGRELPCASG